MKETLIIFLKGVFMGIANIIPGVSGGTIALITGIYERLIHSISKIDFDYRNIDFRLFIPLVSGSGLAILLMSDLIYSLLNYFPAITHAFFFGLIFASAILLYKKECILSIKNTLFIIAGFLSAFLFVGLATLQIGHSLIIIFISGIMAACAMMLPGISGAFVLLLLNQYEYMLSVLRDMRLLEIFVFCFGGLIGVLSFSRVISYILDKYRLATISLLIGMMLGALRLPYQIIVDYWIDFILPIFASFLFGFFIIFVLEDMCGKFA